MVRGALGHHSAPLRRAQARHLGRVPAGDRVAQGARRQDTRRAQQGVPYISLYLPVSPYISPCLPISPYISLCSTRRTRSTRRSCCASTALSCGRSARRPPRPHPTPPAPHPARTPPHPHPTPPAPRASSPSPRLAPQPAPARGQVVKTPECVRVYIGSFWERPLQCNEWSKQLLQARAHAPTRHPYPEPLTPKPEPFTPAPTP